MRNQGKAILSVAWQVAVLYLVWMAANALASSLHLRIPGSVIGMIGLFLLLRLRLVRLQWLEAGANWLLAEMLLFFVPAAVGILQYRSLIVTEGWRILLAIAVSTTAVMICTGLVTESIARNGSDAR